MDDAAASSAASHHHDHTLPHGPHSTADGWTPLYLSTLAGMSTCLGAAIVFCHPREKRREGDTDNSNKYIVSPNMMAFSLALAGSVMLTVSVISIGPECLLDPRFENDGGEGESAGSGGWGGRMMPLFSLLFLQRLISFGLGCLLYGLLRLAFPEVDELETELFAVTAASRVNKTTAMHIRNGAGIGDDSEGDDLLDAGGDGSDNAANGGNDGGTRTSSSSDIELAPAPAQSVLRKRESDLEPAAEMETLLVAASRSQDNGEGGDRDSSAKLTVGDGYCAKSKDGRGTKDGILKPSFRRWASGEDLGTRDQRRAWRVAMLLFVSLLCHNFPEGLAVAASALESDKLGITVTIGIMIHNIPEGIAIAVPCLAARPDRPWLSFLLASFSGLAEPAGAFVALGFLRGYNVESTLGKQGTGGSGIDNDARGVLSLENVLAFVAGIMITVAVVELFPEARRHVSTTKSYFYGGTISGVVVMVLTELVA